MSQSHLPQVIDSGSNGALLLQGVFLSGILLLLIFLSFLLFSYILQNEIFIGLLYVVLYKLPHIEMYFIPLDIKTFKPLLPVLLFIHSPTTTQNLCLPHLTFLQSRALSSLHNSGLFLLTSDILFTIPTSTSIFAIECVSVKYVIGSSFSL